MSHKILPTKKTPLKKKNVAPKTQFDCLDTEKAAKNIVYFEGEQQQICTDATISFEFFFSRGWKKE